jgi:transposase
MDVKDSEWGCMLLRNGLIRGSFIPPRHIRQLRDLTRHRRKLHHTISSEKNRLQKYLEDANIKLSSVATDIFGVSGRDILRQIIKGNTNADELSDLARGTLKNKKDELTKSCRGHVTDHHRTMIEFSLKHIEYMERLIAEIDSEIEKLSQEHNLQESIELLDSIPGVDQKASEDIIAEIGTEMDQFPTEDHLSSWAGMSPGNNESAGKKKGGKTVKGNNWIKALLTQCALCASRSKGTYLKDKYFKLKSRRGAKRAAIAIGHKILISVYHILKEKIGYKELGIDYLDKRNKTKTLRYFMKKIENLGYDVLLAEKVA